MEFIDIHNAVKNHSMQECYSNIGKEELKLKTMRFVASILEACDFLFNDFDFSFIGKKMFIDFFKISVGFDKQGNHIYQDVLRYDIKDESGLKLMRKSFTLQPLSSTYCSYDSCRHSLSIEPKMPLSYIITQDIKSIIILDLIGKESYSKL